MEWARKAMRDYERKRCALGAKTIIAETESLRYLHKTEAERAAPGAIVDGIIETRGIKQDEGVYIVTATLECRARFDLTEEKLAGPYENRLILTSSKLRMGHTLSRMMNTEFWMLQVLVPDNCYYVTKLTDKAGNYLSDWYEKETLCPQTISNPDRVLRPTIYVDIADSHRYDLE